MATGLDQQLAPVTQLRPTPAARGGHLRQRGQRVELSHQPGGGAHPARLGTHLLAQGAEQLQLPLAGPGAQLQDPTLALLELGGDEALLVGQRLAADPVLRHPGRLRAANRQKVSEAAVVLEPQVGIAAGLTLQGFLVGQPGLLLVEAVAQAVEHRVDPVVDQPPFP
jgi:hypothetical protein